MKTWEQMMRTKSISWFRRSFYARMIVWCFNKETITFLWKWTENGRKSSQCHNKMKGNQGWLKTFAHYHIWKFLLLEDIKFFLGMSLLKVHECFCKHPTVGPFSGKNHCCIISPGGHCSPPQREFRVHVGGRGPAPLLQCICIPLLTEAPSVIGCFAEFKFLPLGISSFWLSWHKSCDTLVISPGHQSVSLSLSVCVSWQL